jgi:hypothetical protein
MSKNISNISRGIETREPVVSVASQYIIDGSRYQCSTDRTRGVNYRSVSSASCGVVKLSRGRAAQLAFTMKQDTTLNQAPLSSRERDGRQQYVAENCMSTQNKDNRAV